MTIREVVRSRGFSRFANWVTMVGVMVALALLWPQARAGSVPAMIVMGLSLLQILLMVLALFRGRTQA